MNDEHENVSETKKLCKDTKFVCAECGVQFTHKIGLNRHMKVHTRIKPHKCENCSESFYKESQLTTHKKIHTGELTFQCELCGKYFSRKKLLMSHLNIHADQKPFSCDICGKGFTQQAHLKTHNKIHTGEEESVCKECGKHFQMASYLVDHMRRKHDFVGWFPTKPGSTKDSGETENETFEIGSYQNGVFKVSEIQVAKSEVDSQLLRDPPQTFRMSANVSNISNTKDTRALHCTVNKSSGAHVLPYCIKTESCPSSSSQTIDKSNPLKTFCVISSFKDSKREQASATTVNNSGSTIVLQHSNKTQSCPSSGQMVIGQKNFIKCQNQMTCLPPGYSKSNLSTKINENALRRTSMPVLVMTMGPRGIETKKTVLNLTTSSLDTTANTDNKLDSSQTIGKVSSTTEPQHKYVKIAPKILVKDVNAVSLLKNASVNKVGLPGKKVKTECGTTGVKLHGVVNTTKKSRQETQPLQTNSKSTDRNKPIHAQDASKKRIKKKKVNTSATKRSPSKGHIRSRTKGKKDECSSDGKEFPQQSSLKKHKQIIKAERIYVCPFCEKKFYLRTSLKTHIESHVDLWNSS